MTDTQTHDLMADEPVAEGETAFDKNIGQYIHLQREKTKAREILKQLESEQRSLEMVLAEDFALKGIQNIKIGGVTVYKQNDLKISVQGDKKEEARKLARQMNLDTMLVLQPAAFKSYCKELIDNDEDDPEYDDKGELVEYSAIPKALRDIIHIHEEIRIRVRGA